MRKSTNPHVCARPSSHLPHAFLTREMYAMGERRDSMRREGSVVDGQTLIAPEGANDDDGVLYVEPRCGC